MTESFTFDPRDFITKPFEDCPFCGAVGQFGLLSVYGPSYVKRCRACMQSRSFPLPPVSKRVIYLDQHAVSHMAKALHPDFEDGYRADNPRTQHGFWRQAFGKLDRLHKLQLAVCPESTLQRQESLLDNRLTDVLRIMYEHLAGEVQYQDPDDIQGAQIHEAFCAWLDDRARSPLDRSHVLRGRVDAWLDKLRVSTRMGLEDIEAAEARAVRDQNDQALGRIFDQWRSGPRKTFDEFFADELAAAGPQRLASWPFSVLSYGLRNRMNDRGIPEDEQHERVKAFMLRCRRSRSYRSAARYGLRSRLRRRPVVRPDRAKG